MIIRDRRAGDLPGLVDILRRVQKEHDYPVVWPSEPIRWLLGDANLGAWVLESSGTLIGQIGAADHGDGTGWIERLFVDPTVGRRGAGRALLRHATARILAADLRPRLEVADNGAAAQQLYRSENWQQISQEPVDWGGDLIADVLIFEYPGQITS